MKCEMTQLGQNIFTKIALKDGTLHSLTPQSYQPSQQLRHLLAGDQLTPEPPQLPWH
jgi:hypothetical protein